MEFLLNLADLLSNPIVAGFLFTVIGASIKTFFPALVPLVGPAEKLTMELLKLAHRNPIKNADQVDNANKLGLNLAATAIAKESTNSPAETSGWDFR